MPLSTTILERAPEGGGRSVTSGGYGSPVSSCPALQPLQHQRQPEGNTEIDHIDAGSRLLNLRDDVLPSWFLAPILRQVLD